MEKHNKTNIYYITALGLMAALVFIGSKFSIPIPVAVGGNHARIHFGNIFCLFSGLILGPVGGGLAAGIGSALFDLTDAVYFTSAPFTFVFKFTMAFVCGKIAYGNGSEGKNTKRNTVAGILGILAYLILYLTRSTIRDVMFLQLEQVIVITNLTTRTITSTVNGIIAVICAVPLGAAIRSGLEMSNIMDKIRYSGK